MDTSGQLSPLAIERCLAILREFADTRSQYAPEKIAVVGTAALRVASNSADFIKPAEEILGTEIEIIAGEREASLVHTAVANSMTDLPDPLLIVDVGGASTELIFGTRATIERLVSLPIGAVRLAERHLTSDPPTVSQQQTLLDDIDAHLSQFDVPKLKAFVGTAGTATSIAAMELELDTYDAERVHGFKIQAGVLNASLARLFTLSCEERRRLPGLEAARADVILAGAAIYQRLFALTDAETMYTGDRGVRWGLTYELLGF